MRWTGNTARGDWIRPRLGSWGSVTGLLPGGYEAYVRVRHGADAQKAGSLPSSSRGWFPRCAQQPARRKQ